MDNQETTSIFTQTTEAKLDDLKGQIYEDRESNRRYGHITYITRNGLSMFIQGDDGQRYYANVSNFVARLKENEFLPTLLDRVTYFKSDKKQKDGLLPQAIAVNLTRKPLDDTTLYTGKIKWIDHNKGYGFANIKDTDQDVFVTTTLFGYPSVLQKDVKVSFNLIPMKGKAPLAININVKRTENENIVEAAS